MKQQPEISIIVANYNCATFLPDSLNSVKNQTFKNWECIIIDDGSTDDSVKVIKKLIKNDNRFKLITSKHAGVSKARNIGLDTATGEYIAFLDSDDCYTQNALEILLHLIKTTNSDMAGGRTIIVNPAFHFIPNKNNTYWTLENFSTTSNPLRYVRVDQQFKWIWIWRRIYKKSFIDKTRFIEDFTSFGEDICFMLDLCSKDCKISECTNLIVYHRHHQRSISNKDFAITSFNWFPIYFKHINKRLQNKYNVNFLRFLYKDAFTYLLNETVVKPKRFKTLQLEAKQVLIECVKQIPYRYLSFKFKILRFFLSCLK